MDQRPIHEHLSRLGVKPRLNKRHDGVEISPEDDRTLPDDVRQSILEHEDELVRDLLIARAFKHVDGYLIKRMGETRETHAYNLTFSYFASHEPRVELINHSYDNDDIEGFKSTLRDAINDAILFHADRSGDQAKDTEPPAVVPPSQQQLDFH